MKRKLVGVTVICLLGLILLGSCGMFGRKKEDTFKYRKEQDRIANYLIEQYELTSGDGIKEIEVTEFQKFEMAGFWSITIKVNNKYKISFTEGKLGDEITTSNYSPKEFRIRTDKSSSRGLSNVKMIYLD